MEFIHMEGFSMSLAEVVALVVSAISVLTVFVAVWKAPTERAKMRAEAQETNFDSVTKMQSIMNATLQQSEEVFKLQSNVRKLQRDLAVAVAQIEELRVEVKQLQNERDAERSLRMAVEEDRTAIQRELVEAKNEIKRLARLLDERDKRESSPAPHQ